MRSFLGSPLLSLCLMAATFSLASAERVLRSTSLNSCQRETNFEARLFQIAFFPDNGTLNLLMHATVSVDGNVTFDIRGSAYGHPFLQEEINPCTTEGLRGMCPMLPGPMTMDHALPIGDGVGDAVPGIAYTVPDLDATIRVHINLTDTGESLACLEANISNGQTVDLLGIKWATAIIAGLALMSSAIISGLGHSNAAAHVAANSLSLFSYMQSQAIIGLTAVPLPPIVQSWTQNFQWSMGIIGVDWMQDIMTWYQRSTGGTATDLFHSLQEVSVQVTKRSLEAPSQALSLFDRALAMTPREEATTTLSTFSKRSGNEANDFGGIIVWGIQRVAFRAKIETTNLFLTGLTFFVLFVILTTLVVALWKAFCEFAVKQRWFKKDQFLEFRNGWLTVLKGILFRVALIGFPQICILCLWEFTQVDSPALVVLAVFFFFGLLVTLGWGATKVYLIARRSIAMHRNAAYILFSDPQCLNKWGFLYIQFRAGAYYYIVPMLIYVLIKAMFVGLGQGSGTAQAVGFIILEAAALIAASVLRPWMDKSTNSFNIAICVINFLNAIYLLIFTNVFGAPGLVVGVVGVVLFVMNAAFSLILLLMVIISTSITLFRKNPDARYQFMADDRASFMKSQTHLTTTTELDALAATARGDKAGFKSQLDLDEDHESLGSEVRHSHGPRSPVNPSMPLFPAGQRPQSPFRTASPSPFTNSSTSLAQQRTMNTASPAPRAQNNASPWQRGAGYE
jgi:hypothetical protein